MTFACFRLGCHIEISSTYECLFHLSFLSISSILFLREITLYFYRCIYCSFLLSLQLVEVTAISRDPFAIVNGVSNNDRSFWINSEAFARFGYLPKDNAEVFATNIQPSLSDLDPIASLFIGGWNCIDGFERDGSHGDEWIERRLIDKVHTKRE